MTTKTKMILGVTTCSCNPSHINCMTATEWLKDNFKSFFDHGNPDWDWVRNKIKTNER